VIEGLKKVPSEDQSATFKISAVDTPAHAAVEDDAPLTEWALNTDVSIPASSKHVRSHQAIVLV